MTLQLALRRARNIDWKCALFCLALGGFLTSALFEHSTPFWQFMGGCLSMSASIIFDLTKPTKEEDLARHSQP